MLFTIGEPSPSITPGGVVPVASLVGTIQPGEWVSIYGSNLGGGTANWIGNFPTSLGGTSVTIDGRPGYLSYVTPAQINVQAPADTTTGRVSVMVTTEFGTAASSVTLAQFAPSFFLLDAKHVAGIILRSDGSGAYGGGSYDIIGPTGSSLGYRTVAAKAGDAVALFGTGFGPTTPTEPVGQAFSGAAGTTNPVTLRINNLSVPPSFTGLSGAGTYQINLTVPPRARHRGCFAAGIGRRRTDSFGGRHFIAVGGALPQSNKGAVEYVKLGCWLLDCRLSGSCPDYSPQSAWLH